MRLGWLLDRIALLSLLPVVLVGQSALCPGMASMRRASSQVTRCRVFSVLYYSIHLVLLSPPARDDKQKNSTPHILSTLPKLVLHWPSSIHPHFSLRKGAIITRPPSSWQKRRATALGSVWRLGLDNFRVGLGLWKREGPLPPVLIVIYPF